MKKDAILHVREYGGLLAGPEKKTWEWLAARTPRRINSDHLTLLGLAAMLAAGACYWAAGRHNFVWHERWTWADRVPVHGHFMKRLLYFHLANGTVSLAGNLILMRAFAGMLQMPRESMHRTLESMRGRMARRASAGA